MNVYPNMPEWDYRSLEARHEAIARRAYELWTQAGRPENQSTAFWLQAERELDNEPREAPAELALPVSF